MRFVHYNPKTYEFIGFYNDEVHRKIPQPADKITLEAMGGKSQETHYNPKTKTFFVLEEDMLEREAGEKTQWRDNELRDTDRFMLSDYPISASNLSNIKEYRQELRDYPKNRSTPHLWRKPVRPF